MMLAQLERKWEADHQAVQSQIPVGPLSEQGCCLVKETPLSAPGKGVAPG